MDTALERFARGCGRWLLYPALLLILSGCGTGGRAPVGTIGADGGYHIVQKGETLYAIAWRYGMDYHDIARRNRIGPPYTIYVGQRLRIDGARASAEATRTSPIQGPTSASVTPGKPAKKTTSRTTRPKPPPASASASSLGWAWPLKGEIIAPFSLTGNPNKGIDIAGNVGAPVRAAAAGTVVYAGGNLRGYGKLVIVKHNDDYLSAYGNNRQIRVKEGDSVKKGQTISEVGTNNANVAMLHFEIRRDGKPIDPMQYLPKN